MIHIFTKHNALKVNISFCLKINHFLIPELTLIQLKAYTISANYLIKPADRKYLVMGGLEFGIHKNNRIFILSATFHRIIIFISGRSSIFRDQVAPNVLVDAGFQ